MKKAFYAAMAAAMFAMAPAANALTVVDVAAAPDALTEPFKATSFTEDFSLIIPTGYWEVTVSAASSSILGFSGLTIDGVTQDFQVTALGKNKYLGSTFFLAGGTYLLELSGLSDGSFGGDVTIAAIPEPATWAMMLVGVAAVGTAMRRRNQSVRVAFS